MARISLAFAVVACLASAIAGASLGLPKAGRWVATDLLRLARQRYPQYVGVEPIGFGRGGDVLWTARKPYAVQPSRARLTDGSLQHVFAWQDGVTHDLGSFGQSDNRVVGVNAHEQIAVTRSASPPLGPIGGSVRLPPTRAFLWQNGRFINLGALGGRQTWSAAINDRGEIVGSSETGKSSHHRPVEHAFLWQHGKIADLGTLGGPWSDGAAINDQRQIVGSSGTRSGASHAFLWQSGKMKDLGTLGGRDSEAIAVNERGQVLGVSATPRAPKEMNHAFLWQDGRMTDLGVRVDPYRISLEIDGGAVIGASGPGNAPTGFVWRDGKMVSLGTAIPTGIDPRGDVVGGTAARSFRAQAFLWRSGKLTVLQSPVRLASTPMVRIDPSGTRIVAESFENAGLRRRFVLWTRAG